jgi:hypothetical protein
MQGTLTIGKVKSSHLSLFLFIFIPGLLHCEGQRKTQTFECQQYHLPHAHLDRWDADNHRIKLIIDKASSIKRRLQLIVRPYLLSLFTRGLEGSLLHMLYYQES